MGSMGNFFKEILKAIFYLPKGDSTGLGLV